MKENGRAGILIILVLALFTLLIYHDVIFRPGIIFGQDTIVQGYPLNWYDAQAMKNSGASSWFPYMMAGIPMTPSGLFYPTDWMLLVMPVTRAVTWRYILHTFAAAAFMYLLLRNFKRSTTASLIGGAAFGFSAFFISKVYAGHGGAIWSGIWIPLILLFLDKAIESRRVVFAALTGVVIGIQILGQHPQYVFYSLLAALLYAVWRIVPKLTKEKRLILTPTYILLAALVIAFAFMISAPHLLSFAYMTALSNRGEGTGYEFASSFSLHPAQLITAFSPSFWGSPVKHNSTFGALYWDGALFIGVIPFLLAVIALFFVRESRANYFKVLGVLSVLIALGSYTPFFRLIYQIPGFDMIRAPSKILFLYTFAAAALAAYGLDVVFSAASRLQSRQTAIQAIKAEKVLAYSSLGLLALLAIWAGGQSPIFAAAEGMIKSTRTNPETVLSKLSGLYALQLSGLAWAAVLSASSALTVTALLHKLINIKTAAAVLVGLVFADLLLYADPLLYTTNARKAYTSGDRMAINIIKADNDMFRVLPLDTQAFQYAQGVFDNLESVNGYYPVSLARYAAYVGAINNEPPYADVSADIRNPDSPLVGLLNVKYVLSSRPINKKGLIEVHSDKSYVYYNGNWKPRAFTVHTAKAVENSEAALREVKNPNFNPEKVVILETTKPLPKTSGDPSKNKIKYTKYSAASQQLQVDMASDGYLFLSEVYYPLWKAWVNGKPAEIMPANYLFRAIYIPKGKHDVRLQYVDTPRQVGIQLFTAAVILLTAILVIDVLRQKHRKNSVTDTAI